MEYFNKQYDFFLLTQYNNIKIFMQKTIKNIKNKLALIYILYKNIIRLHLEVIGGNILYVLYLLDKTSIGEGQQCLEY